MFERLSGLKEQYEERLKAKEEAAQTAKEAAQKAKDK